MAVPALAGVEFGKICFSDDFESYPYWQRLRQCPPWGWGSGAENRIYVDPQGDQVVRLKGQAGNRRTSDAMTMPNYAGCTAGNVQILQFTLQSDLNRQNNTGNHLNVQFNESSGGQLARWYGWSHSVRPRHNWGVGPDVSILDGAVHVFKIVYDPATGLCDWLVYDTLLYSATLPTGWACERAYVYDWSRSAQDWVYLDDLVIATAPIDLPLDILPNDDPNLFVPNLQGKGRLPMEIMGTADIDVNDIDTSTLAIADTVTPVKAAVGASGNLELKFSRRDLIQALGLDALAPGTVVDITVEGYTNDGTGFHATDSIVIEAGGD
jgi:hypothetical protein